MIAAPLTTTGYVSVGTIHDQNYVQSPTSVPNWVAGTDQILGMAVNFQCSVASSNGKIIMYNPVGVDGLRDYQNFGLYQNAGLAGGYPGIIAINVQGAAPGTAPFEIEITATFEYTPNQKLAQ